MIGDPHEVMIQIGLAIARSQHGDRAGARLMFQDLWAQVGPDGDPFHRCALAHSMADVQDDPREELAWDLLALEAGDLLTNERVFAGGVAGPAQGFYPSLHLNLADVYRRLGNTERACHHVVLGHAALESLADDGYRQMIRDALDRVQHQLEVP